jgi:uncharacterized protein
MKLTDVRRKRKHILAIAGRYGAYNVRIFGSTARGEQDNTSDIDFLVNFESDRSLFDHAGLMLDLQSLLGCEIDVVSENGLRPRVRENVMKDAVPL